MGYVTGISYATPQQLFTVLPREALFGVPDSEIAAQLERSSRFYDSHNVRGSGPLDSWGSDTVQAVAVHAAYELVQSKGTRHPKYGDPDLLARYKLWIASGDERAPAFLELMRMGRVNPSSVVDATPTTSEMAPIGWADASRDRSDDPTGGFIP